MSGGREILQKELPIGLVEEGKSSKKNSQLDD